MSDPVFQQLLSDDVHMNTIVVENWLVNSDASYVVMTWLVSLIATYPKYQQLARQEIIDTIGVDSIEFNTSRFPFVQALICECLRMSRTATLSGIPKLVTVDTTIGKY